MDFALSIDCFLSGSNIREAVFRTATLSIRHVDKPKAAQMNNNGHWLFIKYSAFSYFGPSSRP